MHLRGAVQRTKQQSGVLGKEGIRSFGGYYMTSELKDPTCSPTQKESSLEQGCYNRGGKLGNDGHAFFDS